MAVPVAAGQWRKDVLGTVYAVLHEHPRLPGRWVCASDHFPYNLEALGWAYLSPLPMASEDYYGDGEPHPGERYWRGLQQVFAATAVP